jgi:hypothetical protein
MAGVGLDSLYSFRLVQTSAIFDIVMLHMGNGCIRQDLLGLINKKNDIFIWVDYSISL